jgi:LysR family transcriptional regulator, glycine cleavage system transcriptional activator
MQFRDLPPLNFLPAFEAAGRLGSVKAAAAQLHVTPSAVSQQLKLIEDALSTQLFERRGGGIKLTREGERYLSEIQGALSEIAQASERLRRRTKTRVLRLSMADFIAYEFILPRLAAFRARFPGIELSLDVTTRVLDIARSDVDAAIRIGEGPWPGLRAHVLGAATVAPVCSHELASGLRSTAHLVDQTLIELRGQEQRGFAVLMKKRGLAVREVLQFDGYLETMRAAEQGLGVALAVFPMTTGWVTSGQLAVPLSLRLPLAAKICFVHREADAKTAVFDALAAWLREQYAALPALAPGRIRRRRRRVPPAPRTPIKL